MDKLHDTALSLTKALVDLMKECNSAWETNNKHLDDQLLLSECRKLTSSIDTITPQVMELTEFLRDNAVKPDAVESNMAAPDETMDLDSTSPVYSGSVSVSSVPDETTSPDSTSPVYSGSVSSSSAPDETVDPGSALSVCPGSVSSCSALSVCPGSVTSGSVSSGSAPGETVNPGSVSPVDPTS